MSDGAASATLNCRTTVNVQARQGDLKFYMVLNHSGEITLSVFPELSLFVHRKSTPRSDSGSNKLRV
jgi:hypothetical protein